MAGKITRSRRTTDPQAVPVVHPSRCRLAATAQRAMSRARQIHRAAPNPHRDDEPPALQVQRTPGRGPPPPSPLISSPNMDRVAPLPRGLADVVSIIESVIAGERRRIEDATAAIVSAQAEVDKWSPMLKAMTDYEKVGPAFGAEENAAVWAPIHCAIGAYREARGVRDLSPGAATPARVSHAESRGDATSAAVDLTGPAAPAPVSCDGVESPPTGIGEFEPAEGAPLSPVEDEAPSGDINVELAAPISSADGVGGPHAVPVGQVPVSSTGSALEQAEVSPAVEGHADVAAPDVPEAPAPSSFSVLPRARAGNAPTNGGQSVSALPQSSALRGLKELVAARCCHRVAASGSVQISSVEASTVRAGAERGRGSRSDAVPGPSVLDRLMGENGHDYCVVLSTARTFIHSVQILDGFSAKRMKALSDEMHSRDDVGDIIPVINMVGLATTAADALDSWSIEKLKEREASLAAS